ncbi:MAG: efflux RND transporter periplasmic adaptor subunit, partial [Gluconacetobacter diazotrophicus]|nr:efflux RND transporter periplasmic adaptor subunit [Gluconacetobacter diazotrophicus]
MLLGSFAVFPAARIAAAADAGGKAAAPPPPAVGVVQVQQRPVTARADYIGRIQAIDRVALIPRVTAYLEKRLFDEGSEVTKGQLLYVLEQPPFQANVLTQQGALAQAQAQVANAGVNFQRQRVLLPTAAGQRQAYDNALASARGDAAAVTTAQGNLQYAQIQLGYTEIRAPVDGRISST